jgi:hypothetical protein
MDVVLEQLIEGAVVDLIGLWKAHGGTSGDMTPEQEAAFVEKAKARIHAALDERTAWLASHPESAD